MTIETIEALAGVWDESVTEALAHVVDIKP